MLSTTAVAIAIVIFPVELIASSLVPKGGAPIKQFTPVTGELQAGSFCPFEGGFRLHESEQVAYLGAVVM